MNLQEFVTETIVQITTGIAKAQEKASEVGAVVNPSGYKVEKGELLWKLEPMNSNTDRRGTLVEFDVAVAVLEGNEIKAGVGIFAAAIGFGSQAQSEDTASTITKIKFSIPVFLPTQKK